MTNNHLFPIKIETTYRCPKCNSEEDFEVEVDCPTIFTIDHEGMVIDEQPTTAEEWADDDFMTCCKCQHLAKVKRFTVKVTVMSGLPMIIEKENQ